MIISIHEKFILNIMLSGERLNVFFQISGIRTKCCFNHCCLTLHWEFSSGQLDKKNKKIRKVNYLHSQIT